MNSPRDVQSITFITTTRAFMMSHRENLIAAAVDRGLSVTLITGTLGDPEMEKHANAALQLRYPTVRLIRYETNSIRALGFVFSALQACRRSKPDILHVITIKMFLLCALWLPLFARSKKVVSISGFGTLGVKRSGYINRPIHICIKIIILFFFYIQRSTTFICQNHTDLSYVKSITGHNCEYRLILGSGVDLTKFHAPPYQKRDNRVVFVGRVLKDKGILEFVESARRLKEILPDWQFQVVGSAGYDNPMALSKADFLALLATSGVRWNGFQHDVRDLLARSKIVCLPSYREGFPKVLIEGAAMGCCLVTTRVPGCVDAVSDRVDGLLCSPRNVDELTDTLQLAMSNNALAERLAHMARAKALVHYDIGQVTQTHLEIYGLNS